MTSCRMVGYVGTDRERLSCAMYQQREVLRVSTGNGYGVAHYTDDAVLLNRRPGVAVDGRPFSDLFGGIQTRVLLAHAFPVEAGGRQAHDLHPFKFRQWALALTRPLPESEPVHDAVREGLVEAVPDFLARDIKGFSCSEALFYHFLWRLHERGQIGSGQDPTAVVAALRETIETARGLAGGKAFEGASGPNVITTDGLRLYALRHGGAVRYTQRDSIAACDLCYAGNERDVSFSVRESHQRYRGIFVAAEAEGFPDSWLELERGAVLVVDRSMELTTL